MDSPAQKVFGTYEILEHILSLLDRAIVPQPEPAIEQLFVLQRVNRAFRDVIKTSLKLRRMMLLEYEDDTDFKGVPGRNRFNRDYGLEYLLSRDPPDVAMKFYTFLPCQTDRMAYSPFDQSTSLRIYLIDTDDGRLPSCGCVTCYDPPGPGMKQWQRAVEKFRAFESLGHADKNASWRQMKLSAMPTRKLRLNIVIGSKYSFTPRDYATVSTMTKDAVLGEVYDLFSRIVHRPPEEHARLTSEYERMLEVMYAATSDDLGARGEFNFDPAIVEDVRDLMVDEHGDKYPCDRGGDGCALCHIIPIFFEEDEIESYCEQAEIQGVTFDN